MTLDQYLISLGINVTSAFIYDIIKKYYQSGEATEGLVREIASNLNIENAFIKSESIVNFLAKNGDIKILGTEIHASDRISISSYQGTNFIFGNNSISSTNKSAIVAGNGAFITGSGGARIVQHENGDISFCA